MTRWRLQAPRLTGIQSEWEDAVVLQARVLRNEGRILSAAVHLASSIGWAGVTLAGVGKAAGLTIRPVRDRYPTRGALAAAAWNEVAGPALRDALAAALDSAGLRDQPAAESPFESAMHALAIPSAQLRAAAEFAVVSCFEPLLREAVDATLGVSVRTWLDPTAPEGPACAAKRGYLVALALGMLATAQRPGISEWDFGAEGQRLLAVFAAERQPIPLPDEPRPPHLAFIPFDTGDETTDSLLRAAIDHLGRNGYERSLLSSVADAAGVSEASVFVRYPSKEAFLVDAVNRHQDIAMPSQREYLGHLDQAYGTGIAEAIAIRGTMHPSERIINVIEMERARLTWHRPNIAAADEDRLQQLIQGILDQDPANAEFSDPARVHLARSLGIGVSFLSLIDDAAWQLPYDVITIPMSETD
jgi:AcrR family transcriptional regulator